MLKQVLDELR